MTDGAKSPRRASRNAGFVACLAGVLLMLSGRFVPGVPPRAVPAGLAIILLGWALFAASFLKRATG